MESREPQGDSVWWGHQNHRVTLYGEVTRTTWWLYIMMESREPQGDSVWWGHQNHRVTLYGGVTRTTGMTLYGEVTRTTWWLCMVRSPEPHGASVWWGHQNHRSDSVWWGHQNHRSDSVWWGHQNHMVPLYGEVTWTTGVTLYGVVTRTTVWLCMVRSPESQGDSVLWRATGWLCMVRSPEPQEWLCMVWNHRVTLYGEVTRTTGVTLYGEFTRTTGVTLYGEVTRTTRVTLYVEVTRTTGVTLYSEVTRTTGVTLYGGGVAAYRSSGIPVGNHSHGHLYIVSVEDFSSLHNYAVTPKPPLGQSEDQWSIYQDQADWYLSSPAFNIPVVVQGELIHSRIGYSSSLVFVFSAALNWNFNLLIQFRNTEKKISEASLSSLKGLNQAKIITKSVILFWLLNMTIWCKHAHRLEMQKSLHFSASHLPVRLDMETKFPYFLFWTCMSKIRNTGISSLYLA